MSRSSGSQGRVVQSGERSWGKVITFPQLLYWPPLLIHMRKQGDARLHSISSIWVRPSKMGHKSAGMRPGSALFCADNR